MICVLCSKSRVKSLAKQIKAKPNWKSQKKQRRAQFRLKWPTAHRDEREREMEKQKQTRAPTMLLSVCVCLFVIHRLFLRSISPSFSLTLAQQLVELFLKHARNCLINYSRTLCDRFLLSLWERKRTLVVWWGKSALCYRARPTTSTHGKQCMRLRLQIECNGIDTRPGPARPGQPANQQCHVNFTRMNHVHYIAIAAALALRK